MSNPARRIRVRKAGASPNSLLVPIFMPGDIVLYTPDDTESSALYVVEEVVVEKASRYGRYSPYSQKERPRVEPDQLDKYRYNISSIFDSGEKVPWVRGEWLSLANKYYLQVERSRLVGSLATLDNCLSIVESQSADYYRSSSSNTMSIKDALLSNYESKASEAEQEEEYDEYDEDEEFGEGEQDFGLQD